MTIKKTTPADVADMTANKKVTAVPNQTTPEDVNVDAKTTVGTTNETDKVDTAETDEVVEETTGRFAVVTGFVQKYKKAFIGIGVAAGVAAAAAIAFALSSPSEDEVTEDADTDEVDGDESIES